MRGDRSGVLPFFDADESGSAPEIGGDSEGLRGEVAMKTGFTLIELLVVIAIIAVLAAILFPVFVSAKESAKQAGCLGHTKQVAHAWFMYADDYSGVCCNPSGLGRWWGPYWSRPGGEAYFQELIWPYAKSKNYVYCPGTGLNYVWKVSGLPQTPFSYNGTSYWYNYFVWCGKPLSIARRLSISPIAADMPYGPTFDVLPHKRGITIAYADGHAKLYHCAEADMYAYSGMWWDWVHAWDGL